MFSCSCCDEEFYDKHDRNEHVEDCDHFIECNTCSKQFYSQQSCNQHQDAVNNWPYECDSCNSTFPTQDEKEHHMHVVGHWLHYCRECQRSFMSANNLQQHLNSKLHRGSEIRCPFCGTGFVTASGVSHHLECGSCPQAKVLNRETIYKHLRSRDTNGVIVNKQLEWHDDWEPNHAYNGNSYECYLCHREFNSSTALQQHLNSPVHKQKIYHCPAGHCRKDFTTLAAMFNHLESESCGYMKFEKVGRNVNNFFAGSSRLISF